MVYSFPKFWFSKISTKPNAVIYNCNTHFENFAEPILFASTELLLLHRYSIKGGVKIYSTKTFHRPLTKQNGRASGLHRQIKHVTVMEV